jgi:hypothetical protein
VVVRGGRASGIHQISWYQPERIHVPFVGTARPPIIRQKYQNGNSFCHDFIPSSPDGSPYSMNALYGIGMRGIIVELTLRFE